MWTEFTIILSFILPLISGVSVSIVSVDKLRSLVEESNYVIALLTKNANQQENESSEEKAIQKASREIEQSLNGRIVKLVDSTQLATEYGINTLPGLIFFRKGNAVIYDGPIEGDALLDWFFLNREPSVQELDDENFEHLTQAATGSTTGDWFILFCNKSSTVCRSLLPTWEAIAGRMKNRLNVAVVDIENSPQLVRRFKIHSPPTFIFFHLGKLYKYSLSKTDIGSLSGFALGWYKNTRAEKVPQQPTPFDELVERISITLRDLINDRYFLPAMMSLLLPFIIVLMAIIAIGLNAKYKSE